MSDTNFILIDLGAVARIVQAAVEYTQGYGLQTSRVSLTSEYDLNCISVTLLRCCGIQDFAVSPGLSKYVVLNNIEKINCAIMKNVVTICANSNGCLESS